jgi:predicted ester cyclase
MSEANKAVIRRVFEEGLTHPDVLDGLYTEDYVNHSGQVFGTFRGPDAFKQMILGYAAVLSDMREDVEDQIAEGDKVVTRLLGSGKHTGELFGVAPTGKDLSWTATVISRFKDGKIAEEWVETDVAGLLVQLGLVNLGG